MKVKYIIVDMLDDQELPFIFPECIHHDQFAATQCRDKKQVVGAGFCHVNIDGEWVAYGDSFSLKVKSRPEDSDILNCYLPIQLSFPLK